MLRLSEAMARAYAEDVPRRRRSARAQANDATLTSAAIDLVANQGWDALTFSELASRARLTIGAVYGRAENKTELGVNLWTTRLAGELRSAVHGLVAGENPQQAVLTWEQAPTDLMAAIELLIAGIFDEDLGEVVGRDLRRPLREIVTGSEQSAWAAGVTLIVAEVIGRLLCRMGGRAPLDGTHELMQRCKQTHAWEPTSSVAPHGEPMDVDDVAMFEWVRPHEGEDPHRDVLEIAALECLGRVGYRRATVARICRLGNMSSGSMFTRFDSKDELIASAYQTHLRTPHEITADMDVASARIGSAAAAAQLVADYLKPDNAVIRTLWLELARLQARNDTLRIETPIDALGQALLGLGLLCHYQPQVRNLPFSTALDAYTCSL